MKDFLKKIKLNEGNLGFGIGIAVMVLAGLLLANYFKNINRTAKTDDQTLSTATENVQTGTTDSKLAENTNITIQPGTEYTVQKGDSLWKVSVKAYGTGYKWSQIYQQNKKVIGSQPNRLLAGTKISLPKDTTVAATEYKIQKGDSLWKISQRMCGSGFQWAKVATDNSLAKPNLIQPGQVLKISCNSS